MKQGRLAEEGSQSGRKGKGSSVWQHLSLGSGPEGNVKLLKPLGPLNGRATTLQSRLR